MKSQSLMERLSSIYTLKITDVWLQSDNSQYQPNLRKLTPLKAKFLALGVVASVLSMAAFNSYATLYELKGENRWMLAWEENAIDEEDESIDSDTPIIDDYKTHGILLVATSDEAEIPEEESTTPETENICTTKVMLDGVELDRNQIVIPENADAKQKAVLARLVAPAANTANNVLFTKVYGKNDPIPNLNKIKVVDTACADYPSTKDTVISELDRENINVTEPPIATGTSSTENTTGTTATGTTTGTTAIGRTTGTTGTTTGTGTTTTTGTTTGGTKGSGSPLLAKTMQVSVEISGNGKGTVKVSGIPYGISCKTRHCEKIYRSTRPQCNDTCKYSFDTATRVTLTPIPAAGSKFSGWGGHEDCSDDKSLLISNRLCIARFSSLTSPTVNSTEPQIHPVNLSARAQICENAENVTAGFIISGSGYYQVMLRGMALEPDVDPVLTVYTYPEGEIIATNDNWVDDLRSNEIPAHLQLSNATDAGMLLDLPVGAYTVTMSSESLGVGTIAINSVDNTNSTNQLINMSTRASIQGGAYDIMAGFVLEGTGTQKVMIRGFGLEDGVDTTLLVQTYPDGTEIANNDDWEDDAQAANIPANLKLPKSSDAGLLLDLSAGAYIVILSSYGNKGFGMISVDKVE